MSSCLILQDKNNFYIGADTACSINIDGKFYRYSNDVQKIFTHGDDVYFCSGDMDVVCLIVTWISKHFFNQPSIDVIQLSNFLKKKYPFDNQDFFDIEIVICRKESNTTKVFQLSQYNNYTLITHTAQENGVNLLCCGYKTQDLYNSTYSMISQGCVDSKKLYKNIGY